MMVVVRACLGRVVSGCDGCIVVVVSVQRGTKLFFYSENDWGSDAVLS